MEIGLIITSMEYLQLPTMVCMSFSNICGPVRLTLGAGTNLSFIGSVGVEGGQGNSDCIFGSCDDHDTFGVSGNGWYGPGYGEDIGNLWVRPQRYRTK